MNERGPIDVLVLSSAEPRFDGKLLHELQKLVAAGTIRVLDATILVKDPTGVRKSLDIEDLPAEEAAKLGFVETETRDLFDSYDFRSTFKQMAPGSAITALAIEHLWAIPLVNVLTEKGIEVSLNFRVRGMELEQDSQALD